MRPFAPRLELLNDTFLGANSLTQYLLPALFATGMPFVEAMAARVPVSIFGFGASAGLALSASAVLCAVACNRALT